MPSSALRLRDLRAIYELAHECRALGDDVSFWRQHLLTRLAALTGAELAVGGEMAGYRARRPQNVGAVEWGWENGFNRDAWLRGMAELQHGRDFQLMRTYADRVRAQNGVSVARSGMMRDRDWYRSDEFQNLIRAIGADHTLWCFRGVGAASRDEFTGVILYRAAGGPDFHPRSAALLREAHALIAPQVGGALARFGEPSPSALPPRARGVLRCLLEGDSDKQAAARLGISKYTVNQYVKVVFNHFGVATRAELLARWVRRGWGNGFAWADDGESRG